MEPRARNLNKLCFYGLLWSLLSELALGASFYGDGFVQLRAMEAPNHNSLHLRFRTSSSSGLLFLAGGETDHFLVELNAGRLQVKLDLGSGERLLHSERGSQLNDLAWHSVEILHEGFNVTLTVDKNSHTSLKMPGPQQDLNIEDGIHVGGSGGLDRLYLPRDLTGFRGCIDKAVFNEYDILSSLRPYTGFKNIYEVSLGCSPQFFASEEDSISFFSSRAYISLPPWNVQREGVFECVLHTSAKEGIVLYSSAREEEFVAVEVQDGLLVAIIGKGGTKTELRSLTFINDRKWHAVKLYFTSKSLQLTVDGETVMTSISSRPKGLQLKGSLFLGGIDDSTRSEVKKMGLLSVSGKRVRGGSFKGCLKDIKVNGAKMGLPNTVVTKDISVGCEPEKEPEPSTTMSPTTVPKRGLGTVTPTPALHMSTLARGLDKRYGSNFVQLRNLVVPEGGRASLESKHIKVLLDFKKLGVRQSQIMFRIQEQPVHGQMRLDVDQDQEENTFSMLDLWHGRAMYIHGGSEDPGDFFMFSIFCSSRKEVPTYLKENKMYRYNITVTPTNDAPELSLPEGNLFVLLENSRKLLTTEVLKATDIDSNYNDLIFSVLGNLNADAGFLEIDSNPGTAVTTFSYPDLEEGKVNYVHTGVRNSRIVLRVSDGEKVSNTVVLRVMAVALEYKIANNTGIEVTQGETSVISTKHLAIQTNALKQVVDIRYDVLQPPQYGELQRLHSSGEWNPTSSFSQRLLEKERLRYFSTFQEIQTSNVTDYFKYKITVAARATAELVFPIKVKWVNLNLVRNVVVEVDKVRKVTLDSQYLYASSDVVMLSEDDLYFRILSPPKKGKLLLDNEVLKNSTFSQRNVTDLKVQYELVDRPYEDTSDLFRFQVFSKNAQTQSYDFKFSIKADVNSVFMKNDGLSIVEGESKLITKDVLYAETLSTKEMFYTVTSSPRHGKLTRINLSNSNASYNNILTFTNKDILEERIIYIHDNSETTEDQFTFIVSSSQFKSSITDDEIGSKEGTFSISVQLVNDEKPVRVVDKVFHVVKDGQKLLTVDDLCYHDADSDFSDSQLVYTRRGIPMGDLVLVNDTSHKLFQFRQKDLEEKRVLFIHKGVSTGRFVLFVSDGKHFVSSLLDVSAHDPFLKVGNNTGLLVQKGRSVTLTTSNFSILTNLDIRDDSEVTYNVFNAPKNGGLYHHEARVNSFTHHDLTKGLISYQHDGNDGNLTDSFSLTVKAKDLTLDVRVNIKIYLESHQRPPIVQHNNSLVVEEGKPVKIDESKLEVTHEDNLPSEIVFSVKLAPAHGYLRRFVEAREQYVGSEQTPIQTFTQEDINAGNIQYMQVESGQVNDTFFLDISNGVTGVNDIRMSVDIIPRLIPLLVSNLTLKEGALKALTQEVIRVTNRHFSGLNFLYSLSQPPLNGHIEHSRYPGVPITSFTRRQVEHEFIYYVHDSSETSGDNFTVIANDTSLRKQSLPQTVYIQVTAVNDEPPVITANRVLRVWVGSVTEITLDDLNAQDKDTLPEELQFMVTPPSNGHLALKSAPMRPVLNFTQAHIDQGQLLFVHSGAMSGGFNFQVNDGVNFAPRQIFSITASALVLSLERNRPLKVFPGSTTPITNRDLQAVTNDNSDNSNRTITFSVIRRPKLGRLVAMQADNSTVDISTFTQAMVDHREVLYIQSPVDSVGWAAMDTMTFSVASTPASLETQTFKMDISYENTGPDQKTLLLANTGAVIMEGQSVVIDKSKLDASNLMAKLPIPQRSSHEVWFQVRSLPQHGFIVVGERNLTKEKPNFSQFILNKYGITYLHDNSETTHDHFVFDTWLNPKGKPAQRPLEDSQVVEEWFNITVTPVNDQPPVLKTKAPSLSVVQGDTVVLGPENLKVEDLDNPPEDVQYSVISRPNNGYLALEGKLNESVVAFTQAQIDSRKVHFIHDGSPASGVFYFSVTDGHHKPVYKLFNLEVIEITISLVNNTGLMLEQGQTSISLTQENLAAQTNGRNTTLHYQVTRPPRYGKLLMENQEVTQFTQEDLCIGSLSYHMVTLTSAHDSFEFSAFTSEANVTDQVFNITVSPLIKFGKGIRIPNGIPVKLNTDFLNASELAALSGSDPIFEVVAQPKYGKVVRIKSKKDKVAELVESFSFQDVRQEKVAIELNANMTGIQELNDSLVFILKAENYQPARGEFQFTVVPYDLSLLQTTESPILTTMSASQTSKQTTKIATASPALSTSLLSTQRPSKKLKGRNRWGNGRNNSATTTLGKPTLARDDIPYKITPVRVESSYSESGSNPLLVILPLLALLLLVIIFVVLIVLLRHNRKRKQIPVATKLSSTPGGSSSSSYQGQPQRSTTVPMVTVTPLSPSCPSSPVFDRLLSPNQRSASNSHGASSPPCSWNSVDPEDSSQLIRIPNPTLQQNQYWV